jgi:drug/metabolite transporter (DMT)-like permease
LYTATLFALLANLFFSASSISFADYSHKYGSLWVNSFKSFVSFLAMASVFFLLGYYNQPIDYVTSFYMLSGLISLAIGDYFLVLGFQKIGPARTLLIFGLQPVFFLLIDKFYFRLLITYWSYLGVGLMLLSLALIFVERKKKIYQWSLFGFLCGLAGVLLDFTGVLITKWCMNQAEHSIVEVYFWRMLGAIIGLFVLHSLFRLPTLRFNKGENLKDKGIFITACLAGTLVSLWFYLMAIEIGPLSSVTAVAVTGPLFAGLFEWIFYKRPLTINLALSLLAFGLGFFILS